MKVRYSRRALVQLEQAHRFIAADDPIAARAVVERIATAVGLLGRYPTIGRPTDLRNIRAMSVPRTRYVVFYTVLVPEGEVRILRIRHTARRPLQPKR